MCVLLENMNKVFFVISWIVAPRRLQLRRGRVSARRPGRREPPLTSQKLSSISSTWRFEHWQPRASTSYLHNTHPKQNKSVSGRDVISLDTTASLSTMSSCDALSHITFNLSHIKHHFINARMARISPLHVYCSNKTHSKSFSILRNSW